MESNWNVYSAKLNRINSIENTLHSSTGHLFFSNKHRETSKVWLKRRGGLMTPECHAVNQAGADRVTSEEAMKRYGDVVALGFSF